MDSMTKEYIILFGEAVLLASMQFSIGSVEMSSKFSVKNFSKDQETLQNAADALADYLRIGLLWTFGLSALFYAKYQIHGLLMILITNILIMSWIYYSYLNCFESAAKTYNLKKPTVTIL
jgi:hypothetical protein